MKITDQVRETMDALRIVPRLDHLTALCVDACRRNAMDEQLAPVWAEQLRHSYTKIFEVKFPEYAAANGDVLPIDTEVNPAKTEWEYFMVEAAGYADFIDDDGKVVANEAPADSQRPWFHRPVTFVRWSILACASTKGVIPDEQYLVSTRAIAAVSSSAPVQLTLTNLTETVILSGFS